MRFKLLLLFIYISVSFLAQENGLVNWISIKEAQEKYKVQPKPILIDFYTDWCGWCKHMMKTTYSNPGLEGILIRIFIRLSSTPKQKTLFYIREKPICLLLKNQKLRTSSPLNF